MKPSAIEQAFALARTGRYATLAELRLRLEEDGCRAVGALLSQRSIKGHLEAICAAASRATRAEA
jgi:hypothetical protein